MKKILIAAAAIATLTGAAGAASAQAYGAPRAPAHGAPAYGAPHGGGYGYGYGSAGIDAKQSQIANRIFQGERSGRLDRREVRMLRGELFQIASLERQFKMTRGLDRREASILNARLDRLEYQVVAELRDGRGHGRDDHRGDDRRDDRGDRRDGDYRGGRNSAALTHRPCGGGGESRPLSHASSAATAGLAGLCPAPRRCQPGRRRPAYAA
jgi:opacity protein-like surface antigen